jgi:hypothetical protein
MAVEQLITDGRSCIVVDCHGSSSQPPPHEPDQGPGPRKGCGADAPAQCSACVALRAAEHRVLPGSGLGKTHRRGPLPNFRSVGTRSSLFDFEAIAGAGMEPYTA